jgi:hypothetical protein
VRRLAHPLPSCPSSVGLTAWPDPCAAGASSRGSCASTRAGISRPDVSELIPL